MNIHAAICDDDRSFGILLKKYISEYFQDSAISVTLDVFSDSEALFLALRQKVSYQILFLDIDMPGLNGIDLAKRVRHLKHTPYFIFVSGVETMVFQSFTVNPFWFVRKRLWKKELKEALASLKKELLDHENHLISLTVGTSIYKIDILSLLYVECTDKVLHFHYPFPENNLDIKYKLSDLEELLAPMGFIRVHKGYLVNYRCIFNIDRSGILLDNGELIPVSKYRLQEIKQLYGSLI